MARYLLVHGCGRSGRGPGDDETALRTINVGLRGAGSTTIPPGDFAGVRVADVFTAPSQARWAQALPYQVLRQAYHFVTDASRRVRATEAVAGAITRDTRILIAHSLGSVAAYDALCLLPRHHVTHFLTLGSPLAMPHLVRGRVTAFTAFGRYAWPRSLARWINFFDARDPIARWALRRRFGDGTRIEDRRIRLVVGGPHRLLAYLASQEVISSLAEASRSTQTATTSGGHNDVRTPG
ncbi:hypothetical protein [Micromonospora sp. KC723]|uniref:hypothetical protein n=1 Tax=Micromonospora sp. KC723 TaxID=2530381 RepID=UPI00104C618E|nr:hypothetical protein [Micromonospora sp. KC723]TDB77931.1 hypothetical protein E1165_02130 [Micromonospora sp. KC723]